MQVLQKAHFAQGNEIIMRRRIFLFFFLILLVPLLGAGCFRAEKSENLEQGQATGTAAVIKDKDGSLLRRIFNKAQKGAVDVYQTAGDKYGQSLSDVQKKIVDEWLAKNQLNEFGDKLDTLYAGGTPLFDELTGASVDRFEYLLKKFPNLRDIINQESSLEK